MAVIYDETGTTALLDEAGEDIFDEAGPSAPVVSVPQVLNPVLESERGLDLTTYLSGAISTVQQFTVSGSERLYVMAAGWGAAARVGFGALVLGQPIVQYQPVTLAAGHLYSFGPFHSVLAVSGTDQVQVTLTSATGVQVLLVRDPRG